MSSDLMLDVGLANELKMAFRRVGLTPAEVKWLAEGDNLKRVLPHLRGGVAQPLERLVVNMNAPPRVPHARSMYIIHERSGMLDWLPRRVRLYQDKRQLKNNVGYDDILAKISDRKPYNANMLDFLLEDAGIRIRQIESATNESWRRSDGRCPRIHFIGTVYWSKLSGWHVRFVFEANGSWYEDTQQLHVKFGSNDFFAVAA